MAWASPSTTVEIRRHLWVTTFCEARRRFGEAESSVLDGLDELTQT